MDPLSWPAETDPKLFEDDFLFNLDNDTFQNLVGSTFDGTAVCASDGPPGKRQRLEGQPNMLAATVQRLQQCTDNEAGPSDPSFGADDEVTGQTECRKTKPLGPEAAQNKAKREKARREKLNEGFVELAQLIDPGKQIKNDKTSIVIDAIRLITQLRAENNQLRQLNKFLEEKVGEHERTRIPNQINQQVNAQLLQLSQSQFPLAFPAQAGMSMGLPGSLPAAAAAIAAMPNMALLQQNIMAQAMAQAQAAQAAVVAAASLPAGAATLPAQPSSIEPAGAAATPAVATEGAAAVAAVPEGAAGPAPVLAAGASAGPIGGVSGDIAGVTGMLTLQLPKPEPLPWPQLMMAGLTPSLPAAPASWLPPSTLDCSQDHKLRPPAA